METMLGMLLLAVAAACAAVLWVPRGDEKEVRKTPKVSRTQEREAHYMRNFWNYDGGEQEEFEE